MSTALVSSFHNLEDVISPNRKFFTGRTPLAGERRMMGTPIIGANSMNRNNKQVPPAPHSTGAYLQSGKLVASVPSTSPTTAQLISAAMSQEVPRYICSTIDSSKHQNMGTADNNMEVLSTDVTPRRKFDRSISEPAPEKHVNSSRYKTELCRPFEENGFCKYGEKCQFAHGVHEMRSLNRHPKYKTELCRTFHTVGFCPYGPRCHFIHNEEERKLNQMMQQAAQQKVGQTQAAPPAAQQQVLPPMAGARKPIPQSLAINMNFKVDRDALGSTADSPPSSVTDSPTALSPVFGQGHGMDDLFNGISAAFTPPPASAPPAPYAGVFTFPDFSAMKTAQNPSLAAPLSIRTDHATGTLMSSLNNLHLSHNAKSTANAVLNQQRNNNLNNLLNESLFQEKKALTKATMICPPSPPDSVDGDFHQGVPLASDLGQDPSCLRLPIFSRLASQDE